MACDLKENICNFVDFNKNQLNVHKFHPLMIANMNEMPIWADMPNTTIVEQREVCIVPGIQTTGHRKSLTVYLCVKGDRQSSNHI